MTGSQDHPEEAAWPHEADDAVAVSHEEPVAGGLFAEIVLRTSSHPENVATEALAYLLRRYVDCWRSLRSYLALAGVELPAHLSIRTQAVGGDNMIPDLVGSDSQGRELLVVEAKFWAGLTPAQPVDYLKRLPSDVPAVLLVVAPGQRFSSLWDTLAGRFSEAGVAVGDLTDVAAEFRSAKVGPDHVLALTSWRGMLAALSRDAEVHNNHTALADLRQLQGLCLRMDDEAFLPLAPRDLAPDIGRRMCQFVQLVDDAVSVLVADHSASAESLNWGGSKATRGRCFKLEGLSCFLCCSPRLWGRGGDTPIWLRVKEDDWTDSSRIRERLREAYHGRSSCVALTRRGPMVAIRLPMGVERDEVVRSIVAQVKYVTEKLALERTP